MVDFSYLTRLWRSNSMIWQQKLEPICSEFGITYVDRTILDELSLNDSLTKKELAKNLGTIHQNLTRSIKRLQEQQLISFATSEVDMRQTHIKITHQGMDINNKINHSINKIWAELLNNIAQPDIQAFTNVLEVLPKQASQ